MATDNTQRMITLLGAMRKQMNGAVADAMRYYGADYGLNYGVSLPTIRSIAQAEERNHQLALYLYKQQVRELRLAALHIADPALLAPDSLDEWAEGIINSEVAEEMAFALLRYADALPAIFTEWISSDNEFLAYAALRSAAATAFGREVAVVAQTIEAIDRFHTSRIIAQAAVAVLAAAYEHNPEARLAVEQAINDLDDTISASYVKEEMAWRMDLLQ
ncbi:MAG: DNA alkylation repair protein [Alistipes sp.]|jgi:3-methyladenine DNA glycosylase AlkD|nr:DNA alkylation repair protein [Alistipes sp.]MBR0332007.1 DNA alkylation repair protein [Alistipes sp.]